MRHFEQSPGSLLPPTETKEGLESMIPKWLHPAAAWTYLWNLLLLRRSGEWSEKESELFVVLLEYVETRKDISFWTMDRRVGWTILSIIRKSDRKIIPAYLWTQLELQQRNGYCPNPHPRAFYGWRGSRDWKRLLQWTASTRYQSPKPTRRIGVGYKDRGTCRNVAKDGSPGWKEVARILVSDEDFLPESKFFRHPWPDEVRKFRPPKWIDG